MKNHWLDKKKKLTFDRPSVCLGSISVALGCVNSEAWNGCPELTVQCVECDAIQNFAPDGEAFWSVTYSFEKVANI